MLVRSWIPLLSCSLCAVARLLTSLPDDIFAFPKFKVSFLNGQPLLHETAHRWLREGLRGGESEFLNKPLAGDDDPLAASYSSTSAASPIKAIDGHESIDDTPAEVQSPPPASNSAANYTLELMQMGPDAAYLCYIPEPFPDPVALHDSEDASKEPVRTPAQSLASLNSLWGTCLYHRNGWFTYSYCHGKELRQFKERHRNLPSGNYKIEEDPDWHAYTLGTAPMEVTEPGVDLAVAERYASAGAITVVDNGATKYLVQYWGNGTLCDKTGKPRDVEIQFHCSMNTHDQILQVKETKTCSYIVVIQTPRLCDEPGFRSQRDRTEVALIQCREILEPGVSELPVERRLTTGDMPTMMLNKKSSQSAVLPAPPSTDKKGELAASFAEVLKGLLAESGAKIGEVVISDAEILLDVFTDEDDDEGAYVDVDETAGEGGDGMTGWRTKKILDKNLADALRRLQHSGRATQEEGGTDTDTEDEEIDELGRDEL